MRYMDASVLWGRAWQRVGAAVASLTVAGSEQKSSEHIFVL
jgi:hypothetical protein